MTRGEAALAAVLEAVGFETDVEVSKIISKCSEAEVVDARWICVKLLRELGYYPSRIAELMGITPRYVQYIISDFDDRLAMCAMMRTNYAMSRKKVGNGKEKDA